MVKSKINQIFDQRTGKAAVSLVSDESFLENYPKILAELGIDVNDKHFAKKKEDLEVGLSNYDDAKNYDIDIIFFPEFIIMMVRAKDSAHIEQFKKALLKYAEYK